ncbi:hypothetical protein SprV_0301195200 [Sparganum proliferum]
MGVFGLMRIHESVMDRCLGTHNTSCTSTTPSSIYIPPPSTLTTITFITLSTSCILTMPSLIHTPSPSASTISSSTAATISETDTDTTDFSCPHCPRTFTSHLGLVGHLRIHRTETDEPVPGTPTYTRRIRLNCPHCIRTFTHCMGLLGHMRIHEYLR